MNKIEGFNIRVYAICIKNSHLLVLQEPFMGKLVNKLPGGGLEFGEGPVDCLKREFLEELNLEIKSVEPFYIQNHFVPTMANNNNQIVMLYFIADVVDFSKLEIKDENIKKVTWEKISKNSMLNLPVDVEMYNFLLQKLGF